MNEPIRAALETRLASLAPAIPIVWQQKVAPKSLDVTKPYAKAFVMRALNQTLGIREKTTRHRGFLQVSLCYPTGKGMAPVEAQAQAVVAHFPAGLVLEEDGAKIRIRGKPSVADPVSDDPIVVPVTIRYESIF
jgi:hypothetical protein